MGQDTSFYSVIRGWSALLVCLLVALLWSACQTSPIHDFSKIQPNMTKDEVLNVIGSPVRTERFDGKEKWAYRFWTGDEHNVETLRQVTFQNGKVISVGEDVDEEQRIKQIQQDDEKRAEKRKQAKLKALEQEKSSEEQSVPHPTVDVKDPEPKPVQESDFIEQTGRKAPVSNSSN